jgi:hypothetical protein
MSTETDQAGELAALRAQREQLDRELVRKSYRIGELEEEAKALGQEFERSLSWRVTRPLRDAKVLLGKLRG